GNPTDGIDFREWPLTLLSPKPPERGRAAPHARRALGGFSRAAVGRAASRAPLRTGGFTHAPAERAAEPRRRGRLPAPCFRSPLPAFRAQIGEDGGDAAVGAVVKRKLGEDPADVLAHRRLRHHE